MSNVLSSLQAYFRFAFTLRQYLKNTVTLADIKAHIHHQVENRDENFINLLKSNVFEYPQSPYLPLFQQAGLTHADVEKMVVNDGLECALEQLYDADVYVTFEEYKGRVPLKRGDLELQFKATDFDMPNLAPIVFGQSGGSTGRATRTKMDLEYLAEMSKMFSLSFAIHGIYDAPMMMWRGLLPDNMGVATVLRRAHTGHPMNRWFSTFQGKDANVGNYFTLLTYMMIYMSRFHGYKFPFPEYVSLDDPLPIAKAMAEAVQEHGEVFISTTVSKCVRISVAAQKHGIDLTGASFYGTSEPSTPAKVVAVEASGAKYVTHYGTSETGVIGLACNNPLDTTDVHFIGNNLAMIQRPKEIFDQTVNAFHFTSLLPVMPKMMINVQSDDFGIVEERDCGCELYQMGFTKHIRGISSYKKLTGEGVTLVGSDMVHILEHVLPATIGGSLLDYQLVEEEDSAGLTKLYLYVDPAVPERDDDKIVDVFLNAMRESMPSARVAEAEYRTGDVVSVKREKPFVTSRGKYFPIRTLNMKS